MAVELLGPAAAWEADNFEAYECPQQSGFPSPAHDFDTQPINLYNVIVGNAPHSTYFFRVEGQGIHGVLNHAIIVVACHLKPKPGSLVLAVLNGEFVLRRLISMGRQWYLATDISNDRPVALTDWNHQIWGPVSYVCNDTR